MMKKLLLTILLISSAALTGVFFTKKNNTIPKNTGVNRGNMAPLSKVPNGVSSHAEGKRYIAPIYPPEGKRNSWAALGEIIERKENAEIITHTDDYLHAVFHSPKLNFKDDVEFYFHQEEGHIDVRAAARIGSYDMGVNRDRIEQIREEYKNAVAIRDL